jgi:hypothetical protein
VWVTAPSANKISLSPNIDTVNVYNYKGLPGWLGDYNFFPNCPSSVSQQTCLKTAMQQWSQQGVTGLAFNIPICSSEFGNGVLLNCDNQSNLQNPSNLQIDPNWASYFATFLNDIPSNMKNLGLRISLTSGFQQGTFSADNPAQSKNTSAAIVNCVGDPIEYFLQYQPTTPYALVKSTDPNSNYRHYQTKNAGYGCSSLSNPGPGQPGNMYSGQPDPNGYGNFPPGAPAYGNFVGWVPIFKALDVVFAAMQQNGVNLQAVDLSSESDIALGETVRMQFIYDPFHNVSAADLQTWQLSVSGPPDSPSSGCEFQGVQPDGTPDGTDVLGWLRCLASHYWPSSGGGPITISLNERTARVDAVPDTGVPPLRPNTSDEPGNGSCGTQLSPGQTYPLNGVYPTTYGGSLATPYLRPALAAPTSGSYPAAYGVCCPSHYGDDSRADNPSMFYNALLGGPFGDSGDPTAGVGDAGPNGPGRSLSSGLYLPSWAKRPGPPVCRTTHDASQRR